MCQDQKVASGPQGQGSVLRPLVPERLCPVSPRGKTTAGQREGVCLPHSHPQASASPSVKRAWRETRAAATTQGTVLGSLPARIGLVWSKCDLCPT